MPAVDRSTWLPLASLFTLVLAGCEGSRSSCDGFEPGGTYTRTVELSPEDYNQYSMGIVPSAPTTGSGETTGDPTTTGEPPPAGMMLSEAETCTLVCMTEGGGFGELQDCSVMTSADQVVVSCVYPEFCEGRRHACVVSRGTADASDPVAAWLARAAHDEAASVHAFQALARELAAFGAPAPLLAQLEEAAADEVRHAHATAALARAHGAEILVPEIAQVPARTLVDVAIENAVEGCVRETWAALAAAYQARMAPTAELRAFYSEIAADETRHAELAWTLDAWLLDQLTPAEGRTVHAARQTAATELSRSLARRTDAGLDALGVPPAAVASHLCAELDAALWAKAA